MIGSPPLLVEQFEVPTRTLFLSRAALVRVRLRQNDGDFVKPNRSGITSIDLDGMIEKEGAIKDRVSAGVICEIELKFSRCSSSHR